MSWFRGTALSLVLLTGLATAMALPEPSHGYNKEQGNSSKLWQELNLTPQQRQQVNELHQRSVAKMRGYQRSLTNAQRELAALQNENAPASRISQKQNEISSIRQKIAELRRQYTAAMKNILTSEQWSKLQQLKKERLEGS